mmetsp:Transcript_11097/g.27120  ORF Transcript_11097/g.27120 Transcript_11097/m.27120 type:complete len:584 (+) Transcript_11097:293-2044(+)|eukprot:CAMPEP_0178987384 /NCGR_PEP_ID=MMETSP0795-20121207/3238_1 /TAXON_ID=88552 /ORGANISM="Amoebophrya sp., Strain Ameob2" /LENGTH=583 /DNA_ID=CAMNT_0020678567 /DNA_START=223 /DNA_END=1974 /DNA_ORIENTATION=-
MRRAKLKLVRCAVLCSLFVPGRWDTCSLTFASAAKFLERRETTTISQAHSQEESQQEHVVEQKFVPLVAAGAPAAVAAGGAAAQMGGAAVPAMLAAPGAAAAAGHVAAVPVAGAAAGAGLLAGVPAAALVGAAGVTGIALLGGMYLAYRYRHTDEAVTHADNIMHEMAVALDDAYEMKSLPFVVHNMMLMQIAAPFSTSLNKGDIETTTGLNSDLANWLQVLFTAVFVPEGWGTLTAAKARMHFFSDQEIENMELDATSPIQTNMLASALESYAMEMWNSKAAAAEAPEPETAAGGKGGGPNVQDGTVRSAPPNSGDDKDTSDDELMKCLKKELKDFLGLSGSRMKVALGILKKLAGEHVGLLKKHAGQIADFVHERRGQLQNFLENNLHRPELTKEILNAENKLHKALLPELPDAAAAPKKPGSEESKRLGKELKEMHKAVAKCKPRKSPLDDIMTGKSAGGGGEKKSQLPTSESDKLKGSIPPSELGDGNTVHMALELEAKLEEEFLREVRSNAESQVEGTINEVKKVEEDLKQTQATADKDTEQLSVAARCILAFWARGKAILDALEKQAQDGHHGVKYQ